MHWCTYLLALAAPVFSLPLVVRESTPAPKRALWLWNSDIIQNDASVSSFLSTATAKDNGFTTIYALMDRDLGNPAWQSFITKCNASGIAVHALMGDSQWIVGKTAEDGPTFQHGLDWITQYQGSVPANAKFAGMHLDVEPWALDGWAGNKATYVDSLLSITKKSATVAKSLGLPIGADLPFWSNTVACGDATLDVCVLDNLDSVTFMTYRNTAPDLLAISTPLLKAVGEAHPGKEVWLSVETSADCAEPELISYTGKSVESLRSDLTKVETKATKFAGFGGIAVHNYKDFVALGA